MMLQLHSSLQPNEEPVNKTLQAYMDTLHAAQIEANLTTTMPKNIPTFEGEDSSKLEVWLTDIETTADILTESCTHLAEAKSHDLTCTLNCKGTQAGKCWDDIKGILRLKLCNAIICPYTLCFKRHNRRIMSLSYPYTPLQTSAKQCTFDCDPVVIYISVKGL